MSVEITKTNDAIELSEQELDAIAGGHHHCMSNPPKVNKVFGDIVPPSSGIGGTSVSGPVFPPNGTCYEPYPMPYSPQHW